MRQSFIIIIYYYVFSMAAGLNIEGTKYLKPNFNFVYDLPPDSSFAKMFLG